MPRGVITLIIDLIPELGEDFNDTLTAAADELSAVAAEWGVVVDTQAGYWGDIWPKSTVGYDANQSDWPASIAVPDGESEEYVPGKLGGKL